MPSCERRPQAAALHDDLNMDKAVAHVGVDFHFNKGFLEKQIAVHRRRFMFLEQGQLQLLGSKNYLDDLHRIFIQK